ncbi:nucleotide excision repair endonuclease [Luteolibacter arcticus]|uniref:Nucleotide excision repair endonuclease n=1 Tax=Luteolibacter arcticus TaxID=1581411 RepID=A0ABT3GCU2_9BACT|nr:nucleotide excision repair endonuclease [Luteolibacter arcticus]MCW1921434.1 nucleotide excision repair endonuclease [Luteolibacter arcticus]
MKRGQGNRGGQQILFRLEDPLTARFGSTFFTGLPTNPGVYFFTGEADRLLYIGQSANLRARIGSYRHVAQGRHPRRSLRLVAGIRRIEWELCESPVHAIARERELLLERRPPFNRAGVWIGPPWWLAGETVTGVLRLQLTREPQGIGPLPPSFRYLLGPLLRGVQRVLVPELPLHAYPHGLTRSTVPLSLSIPSPDPESAWQLITGFATGETEPLLALLEQVPATESPALAEFWQEERERLEAYTPKFTPPNRMAERIADAPLGRTTAIERLI